MVDFISEVQEELRKDDYNRWLKKYGPFALGLIAAVILATAYFEWKKIQDAKVAESMSYAYLTAADMGREDADKGIQSYIDLSQEAPPGYAGLSLLRASELEFDKGNVGTAIALLDQAASTFDSKRHSQLAQMKAGYILAGQGDYEGVINRMSPLIEKEEPYEYLARELLGFAAKENGDVQTARSNFSYLETIPGVPESIQARAKQNILMMDAAAEKTTEAVVIKEETPQETAPVEETENETP